MGQVGGSAPQGEPGPSALEHLLGHPWQQLRGRAGPHRPPHSGVSQAFVRQAGPGRGTEPSPTLRSRVEAEKGSPHSNLWGQGRLSQVGRKVSSRPGRHSLVGSACPGGGGGS